jgi:hypothetical protein
MQSSIRLRVPIIGSTEKHLKDFYDSQLTPSNCKPFVFLIYQRKKVRLNYKDKPTQLWKRSEALEDKESRCYVKNIPTIENCLVFDCWDCVPCHAAGLLFNEQITFGIKEVRSGIRYTIQLTKMCFIGSCFWCQPSHSADSLDEGYFVVWSAE